MYNLYGASVEWEDWVGIVMFFANAASVASRRAVFVIIAWITQVMGRIYSVRASTFIKTTN